MLLANILVKLFENAVYVFFQPGAYAYMIIYTDYVNVMPGVMDIEGSTTYMMVFFDVDDAQTDVEVSGIDLYSIELGIRLVPNFLTPSHHYHE